MPSPAADGEKPASRKRKFHRKSRRGCGNCKLRRVKCDETRPECRNCRSYGVLCSYRSDAVDLRGPRELVSPALAVGATHEPDSFELDGQSASSLVRFGTRIVPTIMPIDQTAVLERAFSTPYLMHGVLAVSAIHARYHGNVGSHLSAHTWREAYHSSKGAALFNRKLSGPIQPQDRDVLWMTATMMGIAAFCSNVPDTPESSWPLREPEPSDLEWLRMAEAKRVIWELANPLQPDSVFRSMAKILLQLYAPLPEVPIEGAPQALLDLCGLTPSSSAADNPYSTAVRLLAPLLRPESRDLHWAQVLSFFTQMQKPFRSLLYQKDPVALLVLALWYGKCPHYVWWMRHRATVEREAISLYLRRHHGDNRTMLELLA